MQATTPSAELAIIGSFFEPDEVRLPFRFVRRSRSPRREDRADAFDFDFDFDGAAAFRFFRRGTSRFGSDSKSKSSNSSRCRVRRAGLRLGRSDRVGLAAGVLRSLRFGFAVRLTFAGLGVREARAGRGSSETSSGSEPATLPGIRTGAAHALFGHRPTFPACCEFTRNE